MHREIKAQYLFEKETSEINFPQFQDGTWKSNFKLGVYGYWSLLRSPSKYRNQRRFSQLTNTLSHIALLRRVAIGSLTTFFQQWTGVNAILYYTPAIFTSLGLVGNTYFLLATGVVGIVYVNA